MMNEVRYHRMFGRYVPSVQPFRGELRLFSLKIDSLATMGVELRLVDAVLLSGQAVHVIPFINVVGGQAVLPHAALEYGNLARVVAERVETWLANKSADLTNFIELFEPDEGLQAAVGAEAIVPGLVPLWRVLTEVDRYSIAATRTSDRAVLDLNPGVGYGPGILRSSARSVTGLNQDVGQRFLAERLSLADVLEEVASNAQFDCVVALNVAPTDVEQILRRGAALAPGALTIVSSAGSAGLEALREAGLSATTLKPPALDEAPYFEEHIAWLNSNSRFAVPVASSFAQAPVARIALSVTPAPLRVLFALRPSASAMFGGDVVQVRRTAQALEKRGHYVVVSTDERPDSRNFDVVHACNLTVPDETLKQIDSVRSLTPDIPIFLMPIYLDHADEAVWGMSAAFHSFSTSPDEDTLRRELAKTEQRKKYVPEWGVEPPPVRTEIIPGYFELQLEIMRKVDFVVANALSEVHRIYRYLACDKPFMIAPSCVDPETYFPERRAEFVAKYGFQDFVLTTGRIEPRKNQVPLAYIMNRFPDRLLVVIGANAHVGYGNTFRAYWPKNCIVIPHVSEEELAGAYAAARVVVQPGWDEVVSLSSLNAAACGASLVLTRNSYEHEYFGDDALYCDPGSIESIAGALDHAWKAHAWRADRRNALSARVRTEYTWERSAAKTEEAYYRLLSERTAREVTR